VGGNEQEQEGAELNEEGADLDDGDFDEGEVGDDFDEGEDVDDLDDFDEGEDGDFDDDEFGSEEGGRADGQQEGGLGDAQNVPEGAKSTQSPQCDQAFVEKQSARTSQCLSICCSASAIADPQCLADCEVVNSGNTSALGQLAGKVDGVERKIVSPFRSASGQYTLSGIVLSIILILTGLVFVFFGHRLFKPILFIAGFYVVGMFIFNLLLF
jgi:hypothetical protein